MGNSIAESIGESVGTAVVGDSFAESVGAAVVGGSVAESVGVIEAGNSVGESVVTAVVCDSTASVIIEIRRVCVGNAVQVTKTRTLQTNIEYVVRTRKLELGMCVVSYCYFNC